MELDELKQTWNEHARKLDRILSLNLQGLKTAQLDRTRSALRRRFDCSKCSSVFLYSSR